MDLRDVNRRTRLGLWSQRVEGMPEDNPERGASIAAQGKELADLYVKTARNFQTIFDVAGIASATSYEQTAQDIVLKRETDPILGAGKVVAVLTAPTLERGLAPSTRTEVIFRPDGRGVYYIMVEEDFSTASFTFGASGRFLGPDYAWTAEAVWRGSGELLPTIGAAEETQAMLWNAMQDPDLNPGMAEHAAEQAKLLYA